MSAARLMIINLAALIGIPYSYKSVESYVDTNVKGTMNLLNSAKKFRVKKFIQTSTSEVYGTAKYVPIDEKHPLLGLAKDVFHQSEHT